MTRRDTYIVTAIAVLGAVAAFWFLALAPKREKLAAVDKDVAEARQVLDQAKQEKVKFAQDQIAFPRMYASLGRLGKAVPAGRGRPLAAGAAEPRRCTGQRQLPLRRAEAGARREGPSRKPPRQPPRRPPLPAGAEGAAAPAGGEATLRPAEGLCDPCSRRAPRGRRGDACGRRSRRSPTRRPRPPAPTGGFKVLPFEYKFKGDFFDLEDLIHNIDRARRAPQPGARGHGAPDHDPGLHDEAGQHHRPRDAPTCFPLTRACSPARPRRARPAPRRRRPPPPGRPPRPLRPPR